MAFCQLITAAVSVTSSTEVKTATTASMYPRSLLTRLQESCFHALISPTGLVLGSTIGFNRLHMTTVCSLIHIQKLNSFIPASLSRTRAHNQIYARSQSIY